MRNGQNSVKKDAAFYLYYYLFSKIGDNSAFVTQGFTYWKDLKFG